ncbi:hypothetical protein IG631_08633 [Alternaria alternata]|nr:hypothetical protein IG631_08633 [Alternaria alternata]
MSSQFDNWRSDPSESHGPLMSITCWSLGGVSLLFLVVRCGIRQSQKKFWYDDGLLVISWVPSWFVDPMVIIRDRATDIWGSMGCDYGYFPGIITMESPMEPEDAYCGKDWSWYSDELGSFVS